MEFSFDRQQDSSDTSGIANERLRKAIERNRQRQREREEKETKSPGAQASQPPPSPFEQQAQQAYQQHQQHQQEQEQQQMFTQAHTQQAQAQSQAQETHEEPIVEQATRRTVARPHDTEFVAVKRTTKRVAPAINYHTTSTRKKSKPLDPKIFSFLVKATWIFAGFLVLRLVFARGGVTDFYSQHRLLDKRQSELSEIKNENMQLVREIERMYSDTGYQKKLVRDNLGFIASDEYLVLFPKE